MKCLKVITASPGLSGSGLISDFLLSQNDFETPFANLLKSNHQAEFRFTHDPGGLLSLYKGFYDNFSITNSSYVFEEFNKYIEKLKKFSIIKNKKKIFLYDNYFFDLIEKFKKKIVKVEYYGLPQFYRLGLGRKERILWRLINKFKSAQEVKFFKMIIPVDENLFVQEAKNLLEKYFKKKIRGKKNIVLDQGTNFWNPDSSLIFYDNAKIILVTRDPRSVYASMKIRKSLSYPGHNVKIFINWYKAIMEKFEKIKHSKNVMVINYENFILQHAKEKKKLLNFIGLKNNTKFKYDIKTSEQNIFKAKKYLLKYELNIIEKKLKKFLQWPKRN